MDGIRSLLKEFGQTLAREQSAAIDPSAKICGNRNVGRGRDDAVRKLRLPSTELVEHRTESRLRRHHGLDGERQFGRHRNRCRLVAPRRLRERHLVEKLPQLRWRSVQAFELIPFMPGTNVHRLAQIVRLRRCHQAGVVVLMTGERQAVALDRVANETDRSIVIDPAEGLQQ